MVFCIFCLIVNKNICFSSSDKSCDRRVRGGRETGSRPAETRRGQDQPGTARRSFHRILVEEAILVVFEIFKSKTVRLHIERGSKKKRTRTLRRMYYIFLSHMNCQFKKNRRY